MRGKCSGKGLRPARRLGAGASCTTSRLDGAQIGIPGFFDQLAPFGREGFALVREADAFVVGQLQGEGGDFELR